MIQTSLLHGNIDSYLYNINNISGSAHYISFTNSGTVIWPELGCIEQIWRIMISSLLGSCFNIDSLEDHCARRSYIIIQERFNSELNYVSNDLDLIKHYGDSLFGTIALLAKQPLENLGREELDTWGNDLNKALTKKPIKVISKTN